MVTEILGALSSVLGMINSSSASNDYAAALDKAKEEQRVSSAAQQAKQLFAENAAIGLPGYESIKEDINSQTPTTLNQAKDWLTGGGVIDFLAKSQAATNQQLRQLDTMNEQKKMENMQLYAQYLGGSMAGYENQVLRDKTQLGIGAAATDFTGKATQNDFMNTLLGQAGVLGDMDWKSIIALLSNGGLSSSAPFKPTIPTLADFNDQPQF